MLSLQLSFNLVSQRPQRLEGVCVYVCVCGGGGELCGWRASVWDLGWLEVEDVWDGGTCMESVGLMAIERVLGLYGWDLGVV